MAVKPVPGAVDAQAFYAGLDRFNVRPLWRQPGLLPDEPQSKASPHVWRYQELREQLLRAGAVIDAEEAERRVLMLVNPGLDGLAAATANLYAGLQLVLPGEVAPAHRHAASALRFVIEGSGAYTAVNGERQIMEPGDLVLTPNWAWHDHGNESDGPMIWLDGLDLPMINSLEANFFDRSSESSQELTRPDNASRHLYTGRLSPTWETWSEPYSPVFGYPWAETERALDDLAATGVGSATDGVLLEYINPRTGGPVLPTLGCRIQSLSPGRHTAAHRHTASAVYHVVRGRGASVVGGETLEWRQHDTFAVPGWAVHEHVNGSDDDVAVLFSFTDEPVLRALGYLREETAERQT
ncbi:MAG: cupin domain-containing protein [Gaiellaceae bacterium MAG52_C11]|nr:cupin domain-containing protein [Candidatus Gaiellasilicea maunaloa]